MSSVKELRRDSDFMRTAKGLGYKDKGSQEAIIRQFHSNGITSSSDIKKAMNARAKVPGTTQDQIIIAAKLKKEATKNGMKTKDIRRRLQQNGISGSNLNNTMKLIDML